jgi:hypothetical protein
VGFDGVWLLGLLWFSLASAFAPRRRIADAKKLQNQTKYTTHCKRGKSPPTPRPQARRRGVRLQLHYAKTAARPSARPQRMAARQHNNEVTV